MRINYFSGDCSLPGHKIMSSLEKIMEVKFYHILLDFLKDGYPHFPGVWWKTFPSIRSLIIMCTASGSLFPWWPEFLRPGPYGCHPWLSPGYQGNGPPIALIFWVSFCVTDFRAIFSRKFRCSISKSRGLFPPVLPSLLKNLLSSRQAASFLTCNQAKFLASLSRRLTWVAH